MSWPPLLLLLLLAPRTAQEPEAAVPSIPGGVTILESRELKAQLEDARRQLESGDFRAAVAGLQKVLDADPAALVRASPDDLLFVGAGALARQLLESLPAEAAADREQLVGARARAALQQALQPPDLGALRRITVRFAGTRAARDASTALVELLLDRGSPGRAAGGRPLADLLPADLLPELPAPLPRAPLQAPDYSGEGDPLLPMVMARDLRPRWSYRFQDPPFPSGVYYQNHRAAVGGGLLYLTDGREITALHLGTGRVAWRFDGDPAWDRLTNPDRDRSSGKQKIVEGFDPKTILAPVLEDGVLLVALQEPVFVGRSDSFYRRIVVRRYLPGRRLYAFDATTGELLWRHRPAWLEGQRAEPQELVAAPPAAAAGRVFLPLYNAAGTLDLSLVALDLHTGEELWRTFLASGGRETNLFGNVLRELAAGPPVADAQRVLMCTNIGAICALDAATGAALWTRLYRRTPVSAPQTGEVSRRQETFPNGPPAYDGVRFVCTPTDGDSAWALSAADGSVVRELRSAAGGRSGGVALRHLVGLIGRKAVFTGSHAVIFDLEGGPGQDRISARLSDRDLGALQLQHAGTLGAGELLVPTRDGIVVVDPATAMVRGSAYAWDTLSQGSLQALPGMVLCFTGQGVLALGSPEGLLRALPEEADPVRLAQALPLIEGLDLSADPVVAARVARATERLAADCANQEQRERLLLVAGLARLQRGEAEAALANLGPLLGSRSPTRRLAASLPLIELLELSDPGSALLERALTILGESPPELPLSYRSVEEPAGLVLWRARARAAAARRQPEAERDALLALLMMPGVDGSFEGEVPVQAWAKDRLDRLLAAEPDQRRAIETLAAGRLEAGPPSPGELRAFAGTAALEGWLRREAGRADLDPAGRIRSATWLRDYAADPSAVRRLVEQNRSAAATARPPLPAGLDLLASTPLQEFVLLETGPAPGGGAWLVLQRGDRLKLSRFAVGANQTVAEYDLSSPERAYAPSLSQGVFLDQTGLTAVFLDRWVRLDADGGAREFRLPGNSQRVSPVRFGALLALLLECPRSEHRLQIRDLATGETLVDQLLSLDPELSKELRFDGDRAYVISMYRRQIAALSVTDPTPRVMEAPIGPAQEVPQIQTFGAGLAIPDLRGAPALVLSLPDSSQRLSLPDLPPIFFGAGSGVGWIQQPPFPHEGALASRFGWLPEGADAPATRSLTSGEVLFLQRPARAVRQHMRLPTPELLTLEDRRTLRLYPLAGDMKPRWSLELPGLPSTPTAVLPERGADGWLVPLIARRRGYGAELQIHLVGEDGELRASASWDAGPVHPTSSSVRLLPDGTALVRNGSTLSLLGKR